MKKGIITLALMCSVTLSSHAQDTVFPQADLYDTGMMNTYINAYRETAAIRMQKYNYYCDLSVDAYNKKEWNYAIHYVNQALDTGYSCGMLYFIRGYAYESNGYWEIAKDDYKMGIKHGYKDAEIALRVLNEKIKQQRKK